MQQLSTLDNMFLAQESPRAPMHIGLLLFYTQESAREGRVRFRDIVKTFEERAARVPVLHRKLQEVPFGLDNPYWVDDPDLNIETHVHHLALPRPGDWRQLCILLARLHARPVDRTRPLWEAAVIEGLDNIEFLPKGSFAIYLKLHHAAVDGMAALHAIRELHDESPSHHVVHKTEDAASRPAPAPTVSTMLRRAFVHTAGSPLALARFIRDVVPAVRRVASGVRENRFGGARPRVHTPFSGRVSAYRTIEAAWFPLERAAALRALVPGSTLNDVVVSIIGGGLRKYLAARGALGKESLVTVAPLSFREAEQHDEGGNRVSAMIFPVHSDIEDPLERLRAVHKDSARAKEMAKALGPGTAAEMFDVIPPQLAALAFQPGGARLMSDSGAAMPVNTVITNVPGPRIPLYLAGARLVTLAGFGPIMDSMGLFHAVMSYHGTLSIAVNSCRELLPDPAFYMSCIRSAWNELEDAAGKARPAAPARRARKIATPVRGKPGRPVKAGTKPAKSRRE